MVADAVSFASDGFSAHEMEQPHRLWLTPAGDALALYYYPIAPDITVDLRDVDAVRAMYRGIAHANGLGLVEAEVIDVAGCQAVRVILKLRQDPTGMTYLASLTLPFGAFSYVIKAECQEHGITGARDTAIFIQAQMRGEVSLPQEGPAVGWFRDPYNGSTEGGPLLANLAEQRIHDAAFPDHPLSRARALLDHVERTLTVDEKARESAPFRPQPSSNPAEPTPLSKAMPAQSDSPPVRKPWWKLW